jgi:hypothetical protein
MDRLRLRQMLKLTLKSMPGAYMSYEIGLATQTRSGWLFLFLSLQSLWAETLSQE